MSMNSVVPKRPPGRRGFQVAKLWEYICYLVLPFLFGVVWAVYGVVHYSVWTVVVIPAALVTGFCYQYFRPSRGGLAILLLYVLGFGPMFVMLIPWQAMGISWFFGYMGGRSVAAVVERGWGPAWWRVSTRDVVDFVVVDVGAQVRRVGLGEFEGCVRRLDGGRFGSVSGFTRGARLDVAGDAAGRLVVFFSLTPEVDESWSVLLSAEPGVVGRSLKGFVEVRGIGLYSPWQTVGVGLARRAVKAFVKTGKANPDLRWFHADDVYERRTIR